MSRRPSTASVFGEPCDAPPMARLRFESWDDLREYMRDTRKARGVTQSAMADALGVAQSTVGNWESPAQSASPDPGALLRFFRTLELAIRFEEIGGPRATAERELVACAARLDDEQLAALLELARELGDPDPLAQDRAISTLIGVRAAMRTIQDRQNA